MTFCILTTCIVSTSPVERDYLSARIALHDIFKSLRYWMYCFDIIQSGKAGMIGVVETGGDVLKLRREMCRMHVYDDTQIEILEKVNEDYKLDLDMESLLEETPKFRSSVCMKVDAAQQLKAKAQDNAGNIARIEKQKRRRESVRQKHVKQLRRCGIWQESDAGRITIFLEKRVYDTQGVLIVSMLPDNYTIKG